MDEHGPHVGVFGVECVLDAFRGVMDPIQRKVGPAPNVRNDRQLSPRGCDENFVAVEYVGFFLGQPSYGLDDRLTLGGDIG